MVLRNGGIHNATIEAHSSIAAGIIVLSITILAELFGFILVLITQHLSEEKQRSGIITTLLIYVVLVYGVCKADWFYSIIYDVVSTHPF